MAISKYINLLSTPISELDLSSIDLASTLNFKKYLNISFDIYKTYSLVAKHQSTLSGLLASTDTFTIRDLNLAIESFLYITCYSSTIVDINQTISPHYKRRTSSIDDSFLSISNSYLEDLLYSYQSTWGGMYGSIAYNLFLQNNNSHYLSPSEISRSCIKYYLNLDNTIKDWNSQVLTSISNSNQIADSDLYNHQVKVFKYLGIEDLFSSLNFLSNFLPSLIYTYENQVIQSTILEEIVVACYKRGYSYDNIDDLAFNYIHQNISSTFEDLYLDLALIRKKTSTTRGITEEDKLINSFVDEFNPISNIRNKSYLMLKELFPPGGYNTLLVSIASELLNRAYILSHYSNTQFSSELASSTKVDSLVKRINSLLYYAGYSLRKSNLNSFNILGNNLIYLSGFVDGEPRVRDLSK